MKIVLIYPYFIDRRIHEDDVRPVPMGVYSVAAVLKEENHDVDIWNWHNMGDRKEQIRAVLEEKQPDVIGFSILHGNRWGGIEISRIAKQCLPHVKIVFGGIGATFLWKHFLDHFPEIDFIVLKEGEYPFLELIRWMEKGNGTCPEHIKGIACRKNNHGYKTADPEPVTDLDKLPIPSKYFVYQHISTTRGCAWDCNFCGSPRFWDRKVRFRSPENVVHELEMLRDKGLSHFFVSDDTFTLDKERVIRICKGIIGRELHITWNAISRVDRVDDDMLLWMRKAGCIQISYGIESGSKKIRGLLNKRIKEEDVKKAFRLTRYYGILPRAYFMYGSPGETWESIEESLALMHEIKPLSVIFYILDLFPGTTLFEDLKKEKNIPDDYWLHRSEGIMYFELDNSLTEDMILSFGKHMRETFYKNLHKYMDEIELIDREDMKELHADFYSRLAMTLTHGDYSRVETIRNRERIARRCFKKSLEYCPNQRAYLGLGIMYQKRRRFKESIKILSEGLAYFPEDPDLNQCIGISYMHVDDSDTGEKR